MIYSYSMIVGNPQALNSDIFYFDCNLDEIQLKEAYLQAVKLSGISLHELAKNGDVEANPVFPGANFNTLSSTQLKILTDLGVEFDNFDNDIEFRDGTNPTLQLIPQDIVILFLEMIDTQVDYFEYEIYEESEEIVVNDIFDTETPVKFFRPSDM